MLSVGLALIVWQALANRELRAHAQYRITGADLERRLEAGDQERTLTRRLERDRSFGTNAQTAADQEAADASASASGGFAVSGPVAGLVSSGGILATGTMAGLLVLRRTRRETPPVPEVAADAAPATDDPDELVDDALPEPGAGAPDDGASVGPDGEPASDPTAPSDPDLRDRSSDGGGEQPAASPDRGPLGEPAASAAARATFLSYPRDEAGSAVDATSAHPAGQRIFERRRLPRVAVCFQGVLQHQGVEWAVTVLDLSETGLRCRLDDAGSRQPPKARDDVRLVFRANGQMIPLRGQVAWRRYDEQGYEVGVAFVTPPGPVAEQLTNLCLNGTPAD